MSRFRRPVPKFTDDSLFRSSRRAGGVRARAKVVIQAPRKRIGVIPGKKVPYKMGSKKWRISMEIMRLTRKAPLGDGRDDIVRGVISEIKRSRSQYIRKKDEVKLFEILEVFGTLAQKRVIFYNPVGVKVSK